MNNPYASKYTLSPSTKDSPLQSRFYHFYQNVLYVFGLSSHTVVLSRVNRSQRNTPEHDIHQLRQTASLFFPDSLQDMHNVMQSKLVFSPYNTVLSLLPLLNCLQLHELFREGF